MATQDMNLWLPSKFLSPLDKTHYELAVSFPDEFPYEFDSFIPDYALNSPVDSASSAHEAEISDEEELFAGSTQLRDSFPIRVPHSTMDFPEMKKGATAGSPQSVVGGLGLWSRRGSMTSNGSPTDHSHFPSRPRTACFADCSTLDLIYEVAGQVSWLKKNCDATKYGQRSYPTNNLKKYSRGCLSSLRGPNQILSPLQPRVTLHSNRVIQQIYSSIAQHQQAPRLQPCESRRINDLVRQEKLYRSNVEQQKEQIVQLQRGVDYCNLGAELTWSFPQTPLVPLHRRCHNRSPPFKCPAASVSSQGISNAKRESSGTGFFLPRGYGNPVPPRKKFGCPTVLPTEVVQALNMSYEKEKNPVPAHYHGVLSSSNDPLNHEILLPQEWTY